MRGFLNPKWIFIFNTIPVIVLFFLFTGQVSLISSLLEEENIRILISFGLALGILGVSGLVYAIYLIKQKQNIHALYGVIVLISYIIFIYRHYYQLDNIIPFNIPEWMISEDIYMYTGTFLMPTLGHALLVLILHLTPDVKSRTQELHENETPSDVKYSKIKLIHRSWVNFLIAVSVPFIVYLFSQVALPLWKPTDRDFEIHTILILIIIATLLFLFFLVRGLFILITKRITTLSKYQYIWKIPIAILLPILGLLVNNEFLADKYFISDSEGVFGDFSNYWFYILAILNGVLICMPNLKNKFYRLFLYIGRCITFAYTLYFFLVFLPMLPMSVVAIIAVGIGFLMLTPLLLFIIHVNEISADFKFLRSEFSLKVVCISAMSFLVIPIVISASYLKDKYVLNETLSYLYSPDYSKKYNLNKDSLRKTLNSINSNKRTQLFFFSAQQPYLTSYYNWLVLDNLMLTNAKINMIEQVFFGKTTFNLSSEIPLRRNTDIYISDIKSNSVYDKTQQVWKSRIDIEITNHDESLWNPEYATEFELPEGCWISDYYLYVGDRKEPGILAEKKSAMWIFSQIRNENRDPGILYYLTGRKIVFRVFPFEKDETRKTGIEFLHKEPVTLNIDNHIIELGEDNTSSNQILETENMVYIPGSQKQILKQVTRKPYFHFLIDVSTGKEVFIEHFSMSAERIASMHNTLSENAKVSFVNSYVNTVSFNSDWKQEYQKQTFEGGFYLDRAIKAALIGGYNSEYYPVIVVISNEPQAAVLDKDFSDLEFTFPENDLFFYLFSDMLTIKSLTDNPRQEQEQELNNMMDYLTGIDTLRHLNEANITVREYELPDNTTTYLPDNNKPGIILKKDIFKIYEPVIKEKNWLSALTMEGKWRSMILHPETSDTEWLNMVKHSFKSKIMTPVASYIVVENEAQKAVLKRKQEQVLSGNKSLDPGEDRRRMSEPGILILILILGVIIWYKEKRKHQKT